MTVAINVPATRIVETAGYDINGDIYTIYETRNYIATVTTPLEFFTVKDTGNFDYRFVATFLADIARPYNLSVDELMTALGALYSNASEVFTYARNYPDIAARTVENALTRKGLDGAAWYASAPVQSLKQQGAADMLARTHAYTGRQELIDVVQPWGAPVDVLIPRWVSVAFQSGLSLRDFAKGAEDYFKYITDPNGNSTWWGVEAWFRVPLQGYAATHPTYNWAQYINYSLELSQQKVLGEQLMAAQKRNGGDDWAAIGFVVAIGIMIATNGAGISSLLGESTSAASASAADALIAAENAIDAVSALDTVASAANIVAASADYVAQIDAFMNSLTDIAGEAVTDLSGLADTFVVDSASGNAWNSLLESSNAVNNSAVEIVDTASEAVQAVAENVQTVNNAIETVNAANPTLPDIPTIDDAVMNVTPATPDIPTINDVPIRVTSPNSVIDQLIDRATSTLPRKIAETIFSRVFQKVGSGSNTQYVKRSGTPATYEEMLAYYQNQLSPENNYGIQTDYGPLITAIALPALLVGAILLSKGK